MNRDIQATTLPALFLESAEKYGNRTAFAIRNRDGRYSEISYRNLYEDGVSLATGLLALGIKPGEHLAILSDNRYEWILTDYACQLSGCADVPRGSDVTDQDLLYILPHSEARFVFTENGKMAARILKLQTKIPSLHRIIVMVPDKHTPDGVLLLPEILEEGQKLRKEGDRRVEEILATRKPEDPFTLIYTSGTTGTPKGVVLTHANILSQVRNIPVPVHPEDRFLTILPIWHIFERMLEMAAIGNGSSTFYTSIRTIRDDLKKVRPTIMASTPRLWEMVYAGVLKNAESSGGVKTALFHLARKVAGRFHGARRFLTFQALDLEGRSALKSLAGGVVSLLQLLVYMIPHFFLDRIVLKQIRGATGGRLRASVSGGGALPAHIDFFFNDIGIPILEGYGLTETSPVLAVRVFDRNIIGSVGPLWPETELRIVDPVTGKILYPGQRGVKGEIHVRGPQIMQGYYRNPEATENVLKDGWFNTGDLGMMTYNNCLKIMGRSKETIVLLSGENVEPLPIENRILESNLISQCMVVGQDRRHLGALVVVDPEKMKEFGADLEKIASNPAAEEKILEEIKSLINGETGFKSFERIVRCKLLPAPFQIGQELNSSYKLKRDVVLEKHDSVIEAMFR